MQKEPFLKLHVLWTFSWSLEFSADVKDLERIRKGVFSYYSDSFRSFAPQRFFVGHCCSHFFLINPLSKALSKINCQRKWLHIFGSTYFRPLKKNFQVRNFFLTPLLKKKKKNQNLSKNDSYFFLFSIFWPEKKSFFLSSHLFSPTRLRISPQTFSYFFITKIRIFFAFDSPDWQVISSKLRPISQGKG